MVMIMYLYFMKVYETSCNLEIWQRSTSAHAHWMKSVELHSRMIFPLLLYFSVLHHHHFSRLRYARVFKLQWQKIEFNNKWFNRFILAKKATTQGFDSPQKWWLFVHSSFWETDDNNCYFNAITLVASTGQSGQP